MRYDNLLGFILHLATVGRVLANTPIHESQINKPGGNWNLAGSSAP